MKKALIALAALAASTTLAKADATVVLCEMQMIKNGSVVTYMFSRLNGNVFEEWWIERNGSRLTHSPNRRPLWMDAARNGIWSIYYGADPSYVMRTRNTISTKGGIGSSPALMERNGTTIASGICTAKFD